MNRLSTTSLAIVTLAILFSFTQTDQLSAQQSQNPYYFGMHIRLVRDFDGRSVLQVTSVAPGGPARNAGLEPGDQILLTNGQGFAQARDSFEAVRMLNYFVDAGGDGVAPAAPGAAAATFFIDPGMCRPSAQMTVRDVNTGRLVHTTVYPTPNYTTPGGPDVPAAASSQQQQNQNRRPWNR